MANSDLTVQIKTTSDNAGVDKAREGIQSIGDEARSSDGKSGGFISSLQSMGKNLVGIGVAFAGYQIVQQIQNMGSAVFSAAGQLEQTNMSYQSLLGNVSQANALFADLTKYANTTPFTSLQINDAAKQLLAFGQTGDQVIGTVKQLGDVTSAGGGDLQALSLVTGQIFAQGKLRAQDMYQVINDGGAGLIHIMAENAGGMQKLTDEFNSGGIPAQQYFDAINKATDKGGFAFQGAQKQAQTFNGMISTLTDSATQFGEKLIGVHIDPSLGLVIDKGGLFDRAKGTVTELTKVFGDLGDRAQPVVKAFLDFGDKIGQTLSPLMEELGKKIHDNFIEVIKNDGPFIKDFIKTLGDFLVVLGAILLSSIGLFVDAYKVWFDAGEKFEESWDKTAKFVSNSITNITNAVTGFTRGVGRWFDDANKNITNGAQSLVNGVVSGVTSAFNAVVVFLANLPNEIGLALGFTAGVLYKFFSVQVPSFVNSAIMWFQQLPTQIGRSLTEMSNTVIAWFTRSGNDMTNSTQNSVNSVIAWFQQLPGSIASVVSNLWNSAIGAFSAFGRNAVSWANDVVNSVVATFESLPDRIGKAVSGAWKNVSSGINSFLKGITSGFSAGQGFASGGYTGSGGVNEVAGVVHKGEYVLPQSAVNQSTGLPKAAMSGDINVTNHIYNQVDYDKGIMQLGFMLRTR